MDHRTTLLHLAPPVLLVTLAPWSGWPWWIKAAGSAAALAWAWQAWATRHKTDVASELAWSAPTVAALWVLGALLTPAALAGPTLAALGCLVVGSLVSARAFPALLACAGLAVLSHSFGMGAMQTLGELCLMALALTGGQWLQNHHTRGESASASEDAARRGAHPLRAASTPPLTDDLGWIHAAVPEGPRALPELSATTAAMDLLELEDDQQDAA